MSIAVLGFLVCIGHQCSVAILDSLLPSSYCVCVCIYFARPSEQLLHAVLHGHGFPDGQNFYSISGKALIGP